MPSESGEKDKVSKESVAVPLMRLLDSWAVRFTSGKNEKRNRIILVLMTALILSCLIIPSQQFIPTGYKSGDISTSDIRATQDYLLEDKPLTDKKRDEAEAAAPIVYGFNANAGMELLQRFEKGFALLRDAKGEESAAKIEALPAALAETLSITLTDAELGALKRIRSERALLAEIGRVAERVYSNRIVADRKTFAADLNHGILLINTETRQEIAAGDYASYIGVADARDLVIGARLSSGGDPRDSDLLKLLFSRMIRPNVAFDRETTDGKKREARSAVRPVLFKLKRGEMIVRVGERISEEQAVKLEKIFETRHGLNSIFVGFGIFGLVHGPVLFPLSLCPQEHPQVQPGQQETSCFSVF